ncbi:MAG TPA: TonB-dependent receptor [Planctomycetota bacterium]|nr:TonB-dependent receptor [Planctomycetota bacterium]
MRPWVARSFAVVAAVLPLVPGRAHAEDAPPPAPVPAPVPAPAPPQPPTGTPVAPREVPPVLVEAERYVTAPDGTISTPTNTVLEDLRVPRATSTVTAKDIFEQGARTVPQALEQEPGVFVQQTNLGGGSPIIRGLTGEQVLLLLDGIRLNNATTRSGPTQYANSIDPFMVERIEVLRGPGSVLYGSDALGGVINVVPRRRDRLTCCLDVGALLAGQYHTATDGGTVAVRGEGSWQGLGFTGGFNGHRFEDLRIGDGETQDQTAYRGLGADLLLETSPGPGQRLAIAYQWFEDRDVPRTDAVESGRNLLFQFDPQRRQILYADWRGDRPGAFLESWRLNANVQRWDEGRIEIRPNRPDVERHLYDRVDTWGVFGHVTLRPHCDHRVTAGFELYHDDVYSRRTDVDNVLETETAGQARYPTGSTWTPFGVYVQDEWSPTSCVLVVAGLRYSRYDLHTSERTDSNPDIPTADNVTDQVTGSLAVSVEVARGIRPYASIAQGFRAPNVDDTTVFDRAASGIEVPNADLEPEEVLAYEVGVKADRGTWHGGTSVFYSDFKNLIQRVPGTWQGSPEIDGLPVSTRENVADATMYGIEAWGEVLLCRDWRIFGNVSWVHGTDDTTDEPLNKVPPLNGLAGARWTRSDERWWVEPYVRWAAKQDRISEADEADFRIGPDGTDSWWTANLRVGYDTGKGFRWVAEAANVFDEKYKHHGSGTWDPGRSLILSIEADV